MISLILKTANKASMMGQLKGLDRGYTITEALPDLVTPESVEYTVAEQDAIDLSDTTFQDNLVLFRAAEQVALDKRDEIQLIYDGRSVDENDVPRDLYASEVLEISVLEDSIADVIADVEANYIPQLVAEEVACKGLCSSTGTWTPETHVPRPTPVDQFTQGSYTYELDGSFYYMMQCSQTVCDELMALPGNPNLILPMPDEDGLGGDEYKAAMAYRTWA